MPLRTPLVSGKQNVKNLCFCFRFLTTPRYNQYHAGRIFQLRSFFFNRPGNETTSSAAIIFMDFELLVSLSTIMVDRFPLCAPGASTEASSAPGAVRGAFGTLSTWDPIMHDCLVVRILCIVLVSPVSDYI